MNKKITGRLTVKKKQNRDHYMFQPYNPKYPNFEVEKNPF
jgi:SOS-response transcriptional repressor LexA